MNHKRLVWMLLLVGVAVRVLLVFTTIGTTDVVFWTLWSNLVEKRGISASYAVSAQLNHPPLTLAILHLLRMAAGVTGIELTDLLRALQIAADCISAIALTTIARRIGRNPWWMALYFFLTPVAIFVSGFHCNTDSTMVMLMLVALALFVHERDVAAGAALGLAVAIKVPSLLLLPFMIVAAKKRSGNVAAGFAAVTLLTWTGTVVSAGSIVLKNIFGYHGMAGSWGIPAVTADLAITTGAGRIFGPITTWYLRFGQWVLVAAMALLGLIFLRQVLQVKVDEPRRELLAVTPLAYLALLFFAPGFGIQYMLWPLPFMPMLFGKRAAIVWATASSLFMFIVYTFWSGGFPWWYADAMQRRPGEAVILRLVHGMWLIIGVFLVAGIWTWLRRREAVQPQ